MIFLDFFLKTNALKITLKEKEELVKSLDDTIVKLEKDRKKLAWQLFSLVFCMKLDEVTMFLAYLDIFVVMYILLELFLKNAKMFLKCS